jgi:hypothetical protein
VTVSGQWWGACGGCHCVSTGFDFAAAVRRPAGLVGVPCATEHRVHVNQRRETVNNLTCRRAMSVWMASIVPNREGTNLPKGNWANLGAWPPTPCPVGRSRVAELYSKYRGRSLFGHGVLRTLEHRNMDPRPKTPKCWSLGLANGSGRRTDRGSTQHDSFISLPSSL